MVDIRKAQEADYEKIAAILAAIVSKGEVFAYPLSSTPAEQVNWWCNEKKHTYVAVKDGEIAGTFYIQDNQAGPGSHIANAGYAVAGKNAGDGIGRLMGEYSLAEAKRLGYSAMQFNLVVKCNEVAVRLWKKLGFEVIGEIPDAFNHSKNGLVNAYIMYRKL